MEKNNVERINKLTAAQEGILFQILSNEYHPKYSVQRLYKSKIPLDTEKCQSILDKLTHMYSALRTVIIYKDVKHPVAVTLKSIKNKINFFTVGNSEELKKTCNQRYLKTFDIQTESAVRMDIIKNNADYYLCLTTNHLLVDGKSFDNLILSFMKFLVTIQIFIIVLKKKTKIIGMKRLVKLKVTIIYLMCFQKNQKEVNGYIKA